MKALRFEQYAFLALCGLLIGFVSTIDYHRVVDYLYSDEAVYYMMADSIAQDRDIEYTREDLVRFYKEGWHIGPQGVFLNKTDEGQIFFSKNFTYAFFLAPFLLVFGLKGFLVLNGLLFFLVILMGWLYLRQHNSGASPVLIAFTFFLLSAGFLYIFWLTPEIFNMFSIMLGLFLWLYKRETPNTTFLLQKRSRFSVAFAKLKWLFLTPQGRLYLAPIPIAVAAASKLPNILFFGPIILDVLFFEQHAPRLWMSKDAGDSRVRLWNRPFARRIAKLLLICGIFAFSVGVFYGIQYLLTGQINPYAGDRRTFYGQFPLDDSQDVWTRGVQLTSDTYWTESFFFHPKALLANIYYYLFGRFTGLLPYFFCSFVALYYFITNLLFRRVLSNGEQRERWRRYALLLAIIASAGTYIVMMPINYQGGGGAFGNRYFVNIYPALLFLIMNVASVRPIIVSWFISSLFLAQALVNPFQSSYFPAAHAFRFPYRWLPVELTLVDTLPTNVSPRLMQTANNNKGLEYRLYFFDDYATDISAREFWVKGSSKTEFALRTFLGQRHIALTLTNGPEINQIDVSVAGRTRTIFLSEPGEQQHLVFQLQNPMPYFDSAVYPISIRSHTGFLPHFDPLSDADLQDRRNLGCRINLSLQPLDVATRYLELQKAEEALRMLESLPTESKDSSFAHYLLGDAYRQLGRYNEALQEFLRAYERLPDFQSTMPSQYALPGQMQETSLPASRSIAPIQEVPLEKWLAPVAFSYEAEDFAAPESLLLKQSVVSGGMVVVSDPSVHRPGYLVYGQHAEFPAGQYQVRYRLHTQNTPGSPTDIAATLDVYSQTEGTLARRNISMPYQVQQPTQGFRDYTINLDLLKPATLEFRVKRTGPGLVAVDSITVYPRLPLQIYHGIAGRLHHSGNLEEAYHLLRQVIDIDPSTLEVQSDWLSLLVQLQNWEEIRTFLQSHLSLWHSGLATVIEKIFQETHTPVSGELRTFLDRFLQQFSPATPAYYEFDKSLAFLGYERSPSTLRAGEQMTLRYYWKALQPMTHNYMFFVHFTKQHALPGVSLFSELTRKFKGMPTDRFQQDHPPMSGTYPTSRWIPGERLEETYSVTIPQQLDSGTYDIWLGVYHPVTGKRLATNGVTKINIGEITLSAKD